MIDGFCGWWVMVIFLACIWTWGSEGLFNSYFMAMHTRLALR